MSEEPKTPKQPVSDDQNEALLALLYALASDESRDPDDRALARVLASYRPPSRALHSPSRACRKPSRGQGA